LTLPVLNGKVKQLFVTTMFTVLPLVNGPESVIPFSTAKKDDPVAALFKNKQQLLDQVKQPLTIAQFASEQPVKPLNIDSIATETGRVFGFSKAWQDSLAKGITAYQAQQGYKYFDAAASQNLTDLNIYNQEFLDLSADNKKILSNKIINPKNNSLTIATYAKLPSAEIIAASGTEKLHRTHWQMALNFSVAGYADTLAKAAAVNVVTDSTSWQSWNRQLLADKDYIAGAGGNIVELGAYAEQRWGLWAEEHQKLRGVHEGRHGPSSDHYSHKFIQRGTDFSEAIDIFGHGRQYGPAITARLDSFYHYHVLPHRDLIGVPRVIVDQVYSKALKEFVNPGRAVWELRGHYGDHIHVSEAEKYAVLYAGEKAIQENAKRQKIHAYFNGSKSLPVKKYAKVTLPADKNIIVINRDSVIALDASRPFVSNVQQLKNELISKKSKKKTAQKSHNRKATGKNKKLITFQQNKAASYPPANVHHWLHNARSHPAVRA
jgi:hypothetical protein